jgi:hypothetical protein
VRYVAARDLGFVLDPNDPEARLDVCPEGTELVMIPRDTLTASERDSLERLTDPKKVGDDVRVLPFRWKDRVRFLRMGRDVRISVGSTRPKRG